MAMRDDWTALEKLIFLRGSGVVGGAAYETITGNPVSFTAKAAPLRQLEVAFSPVQDLHGYDSPWPAGGGKNKLNSVFLQGSALELQAPTRIVLQSGIPVQAGKTYTFSASDYADFMYVLNSSATDGLPIAGDYSYCGTSTVWAASDITFTATNNGFVYVVIRKPNNSEIAPSDVASVKMQFEEGSTATSYAPYSNECPISGWDSVTVNRTGKNLYYYDATKATTGETTAGKIRGYYPLGLRNCTLTFSASLIEGETPTPGNINIGKLSNGKLSVLNDFLTPSAIRQRTFTFAADEEAVLMSVSTNTGGITDKLPHYNIMVEIGETAHDYEAYNGRSISITFPAMGANQWDEEWLVGYISNADGVIHESSGQTRIVSKNKIPVQPSTEYYVAGTASITVYGFAQDESYVGSISVSSRKFTTPANVYYVCFETSSAYGNTYNHDIAINYPATVTTYSPYTNTVYSGYVDVVTGVGEIDYVKDVYDGSSDEVWGYTISETPSAFYTQITLPANNPQSMGNYLKRVTAFGAVSGFSYIIHSAQIRVSDMGGECADTTQAGAIAKLRAYLAANPFEVVHKITTPIPIQLTPQEVESIAGDNTMWTDGDSLEVTYRSN